MKILVAGGMGYIGSHTCVELLNKGYEVVIADNLSNSNINVLDSIKEITEKYVSFEMGNLANAQETRNLFEKHHDIDAVINFAASKAVGESVNIPLMYYNNNLNILLNLLAGMDRWDIQYFVQSSSCTVYGEPDTLPISENCPVKPALSPYGNTKKIAEDILFDVSKVTSMNTICLRYFNPIGAHESALIGEYPNGVPNNLMPFVTQTAIGIRDILSVFGKDYNTHDGTCIRDYIHVVDLAISHIASLERLLKKKNKNKFETFNIGTGNGFSVLDVIKSFEKTSGLKLKYKFVKRRDGDVEQIWADTTLANTELGWKAEKTLDEMILSAWKWELHLNEKKL